MEYYCTGAGCPEKASSLIIYGCLESHIYQDVMCDTCLQRGLNVLENVILTGEPKQLRCPECNQVFTEWLINKNWPPNND